MQLNVTTPETLAQDEYEDGRPVVNKDGRLLVMDGSGDLIAAYDPEQWQAFACQKEDT